jgi:protein-tyrosine phosphatase
VSWPSDRSRDGGADRVPLPAGVPGALWLCGKHWIGPDGQRAHRQLGAEVVVCLCQRHELADRYPDYVAWLVAPAGPVPVSAHWAPVHDLHAPPPEEADALIGVVTGHLKAGRSVLVHCGAGIGRAGTLAAAVLMALGLARAQALTEVAAARPLAGPEAGAQSDLLEALEERSVQIGTDLGAAGPGPGRGSQAGTG